MSDNITSQILNWDKIMGDFYTKCGNSQYFESSCNQNGKLYKHWNKSNNFSLNPYCLEELLNFDDNFPFPDWLKDVDDDDKLSFKCHVLHFIQKYNVAPDPQGCSQITLLIISLFNFIFNANLIYRNSTKTLRPYN